MSQQPNIDGVLIQWGDRLFYPGNRIVRVAPSPTLVANLSRRHAAAIRARIESRHGVTSPRRWPRRWTQAIVAWHMPSLGSSARRRPSIRPTARARSGPCRCRAIQAVENTNGDAMDNATSWARLVRPPGRSVTAVLTQALKFTSESATYENDAR